jgi:hypothetical protein
MGKTKMVTVNDYNPESDTFAGQLTVMIRRILFALLLLVFFLHSAAQDEQTGKTPPADQMKMFSNLVSQKLKPTKNQKDSLMFVFRQFTDDVLKYRARENDKIYNYLVKTRDDKVKNILHDDTRFEKYLLMMEDMKKNLESPQNPAHQQKHEIQPNPMGGGPQF